MAVGWSANEGDLIIAAEMITPEDGDRERCPMQRSVIAHHRRKLQFIQLLAGHRQSGSIGGSLSQKQNLQLNNPATYGDSECLGTIISAKLSHNVFHVSLYGFLGDKEFLRDVTVAIPVH
jgi:hypothetical protein